jgi:hypothetical protein
MLKKIFLFALLAIMVCVTAFVLVTQSFYLMAFYAWTLATVAFTAAEPVQFDIPDRK